jgi:hypothetical protein
VRKGGRQSGTAAAAVAAAATSRALDNGNDSDENDDLDEDEDEPHFGSDGERIIPVLLSVFLTSIHISPSLTCVLCVLIFGGG